MTSLHPKLTVRLFTDEKCFGPGVAELLQRVDTLHSLRAAALSMEMSYSKAWNIVKRAEAGLGFALLHSVTGGRSGGGATLTAQAVRLLRDYAAYTGALEQFAQDTFRTTLGWLTEAGHDGE